MRQRGNNNIIIPILSGLPFRALIGRSFDDENDFIDDPLCTKAYILPSIDSHYKTTKETRGPHILHSRASRKGHTKGDDKRYVLMCHIILIQRHLLRRLTIQCYMGTILVMIIRALHYRSPQRDSYEVP